MRKIIITISLLLFLTGCGNKITCKTTKDLITEEYEIKYNNDTVTTVKLLKTYKFNTKAEFKNYEGIMRHTAVSNTTDNIKSSYKKKNKKYILKQIFDVEKLSDEELTKYGLEKNKEKLIDNLKNNGLKCK